MSTTDLPEAAGRRLQSKAFSSGLSVQEFAACQHMGMRPVGLVQGFCVMGWRWYYGQRAGGYGGYYGSGNTLSTYNCPHPIIHDAEHRSMGWNSECTDMQDAWGAGYNAAYQRLMEEAKEVGAHGIIGITDATKSLIDSSVREFHLYGTAVVLDDAGQKLAKLFEAGLLPVSVIASLAAVSVQPVCVTEYLESGRQDPYGMINYGGEITQLSDAHTEARRLARDHLKARLGGDALHGAEMDVTEQHGYGVEVIAAELRGTRVRRFRDAEPLPAPMPTVRLT
jgi:uncharacterized protein YbjQ (UPF0145 family)